MEDLYTGYILGGKLSSVYLLCSSLIFILAAFLVTISQYILIWLNPARQSGEGHELSIAVAGTEMDDYGADKGDPIQNLTERYHHQQQQIRDLEAKLAEEEENLEHTHKAMAIGELAGSISHEINSPLSVIHGLARRTKRHMKKGKIECDDVIESMEKIEATADRIFVITKGLERFSSQTHSEPIDTSLASIIRDSIYYSQKWFQSRGVRFITGIQNDDACIHCYPEDLILVLINILNHCTSSVCNLSEKWIAIDINRVGDYWQLLITDSSKTIEQEVRDAIETPFIQRSGVDKGDNFNLSIISGLIRNQEGRIRIGNDPKVMKFSIEFPIANEARNGRTG